MYFRLNPFYFVCIAITVLAADEVSTGYRVVKVNHELLDEQGETHGEIGDFIAKAQYQKQLEESKKAFGVRFMIHWKAPSSDISNFAVRVDAQGLDADTDRETLVTLTQTYLQIPGHDSWTTLDIKKESFTRLGKLMAWKVTLLQNSEPVATQKSFTWDDRVLTPKKSTETQ